MPNSCHVIMDVISKMALYSPQGPLEIVKKQFLPHTAVSVLLFRTLDLKFSVKCLKVNLIIDFERVIGAPRMAKKQVRHGVVNRITFGWLVTGQPKKS